MRQRVVIMEKSGHLGALGVMEAEGFEIIRSFDSRVGVKTGDRAQVVVTAGYSAPIVAAEVARSEARGWRVFYEGPPLLG